VPEPLVLGEIDTDRDARQAIVAGEHIGQLVSQLGELRADHKARTQPAAVCENDPDGAVVVMRQPGDRS
jgi:hypothetical protein